jgi:hypothetical protein
MPLNILTIRQLVDGTQQFHLLVPAEVAQIENAGPAKGDEHSQRADVLLTAISVHRGHTSARRIGLTSARQRCQQYIAIARDKLKVHRANIECLADLGRHVLVTLIRCRPLRIQRRRGKRELAWRRLRRRRFAVGSVIKEGADRQLRQQRLQAAHMIRMVMSYEEIVDFRHSERGGSGGDAVGARRHRGRRWGARNGARTSDARGPAGVDQ